MTYLHGRLARSATHADLTQEARRRGYTLVKLRRDPDDDGDVRPGQTIELVEIGTVYEDKGGRRYVVREAT
jgi:hypothetical protein